MRSSPSDVTETSLDGPLNEYCTQRPSSPVKVNTTWPVFMNKTYWPICLAWNGFAPTMWVVTGTPQTSSSVMVTSTCPAPCSITFADAGVARASAAAEAAMRLSAVVRTRRMRTPEPPRNGRLGTSAW